MEIPAEILDVLKCSSCEFYLSRGSVYLQHDGAAVCGRCYTPKRPATRNKQYEATAKLLKFPCKNQELGCFETVPYVGQDEEIAHEEVCEHRQYVCPVLGSAHCDWLGPRAAILVHCRDQHPDSVLENPCSLIHDIVTSNLRNYIITAYQMIFLLHTKICIASGMIYHAVRLLGTSAEAADYFFNLDIKCGDEQLSKTGQVAPQGCLAIQEPTSLAVNTNSLLDVLGGFDDATFTVTVKRRVSDATNQLVRAMEKCAVCVVEVTVFLYRDKDGWRCERCAPARRACTYQGCMHTDIDKKCRKHEMYFCYHRTKCFICWAAVSRGSLSVHYDSVHQEITYSAGSMWRATKTGFWPLWGRLCLVSSVVGTAVCRYQLLDSQFFLYVRIPVSNERLREFRCEVRIINPATGHARTFTPDALYDKLYDWLIEIWREEFPSWNTEFDVCVDIRKSEI